MRINSIENVTRGSRALEPADLNIPKPGAGEILIRVLVCGVCHTEIDEIEGRAKPSFLPITPGHQVVGVVEKVGSGCSKCSKGDRVGVAWIYSTCGDCIYCIEGRENLCTDFKATGKDADGGYGEFMIAKEAYTYPLNDCSLNDSQIAPLLCAGAIGYRSLMMCDLKDGDNLGLTGFGASAHIVIRLARALYPSSKVFVFARNSSQREFAKSLGAHWTGDTNSYSPEKLSSVIDTTPAWKPVVESLKNLCSGGRLVINAVSKEDTDKYYLQKLDYYSHLWREKEIKSVANLTRKDVANLINCVSEYNIVPEVTQYPLESANDALYDIKYGGSTGAKVLRISS